MINGESDDGNISVQVPVELPPLTQQASRILLAILVELTEVEVLDEPSGRGPRDC